MLLRVDVQERDDHALVTAAGEIDASTAHQVASAAAQAVFAVVHPTTQTRKLIRVLGLDQLLLVYDNQEQALSEIV